MQAVLVDFINALRLAGLPVSPAESLDAMQAIRLIGIEQPNVLKSTLTMTLAKTQIHKVQLEALFDQFFFAQLKTENQNETEQETQNTQEEPDTSQQDQSAQNESPACDNPAAMASTLAQQLLNNDKAGLMVAISSAAQASGIEKMQVFTQIPMVSFRIMKALGDAQLNKVLNDIDQSNEKTKKDIQLYEILSKRQKALRQKVKDYVEQQFLLFGQEKAQNLKEAHLQSVKLSNVDHRYYDEMGKLVHKAAKQLSTMHSRRRRQTKHGQLDVRKTIAANAAYDGFLFHTKWKSSRIDRPKVLVICDVSGSVSKMSRFLLLFLYSLQDVLPKVRSFVFASSLAEVTDDFKQHDTAKAISGVMERWANLPTDYGQALSDFKALALKDIDNKTTVIMLGDARNNYGEANQDIWQEVYQRSKRVLWLNPEGRFNWNSGDSIMDEYSPFCSQVEHCSSLRDLTRILGSMLKNG